MHHETVRSSEAVQDQGHGELRREWADKEEMKAAHGGPKFKTFAGKRLRPESVATE